VWTSIRCDAPGLDARSNAGVENVSTSFHTPREPQRSTPFGQPRNKSLSRSKDGTFLMRLLSVMGGACTPTAATPLLLTRMGGCRSRLRSFQPRTPKVFGGIAGGIKRFAPPDWHPGLTSGQSPPHQRPNLPPSGDSVRSRLKIINCVLSLLGFRSAWQAPTLIVKGLS
jgi:hypothetical protein